MKVFISYAREDEEAARRLHAGLLAAGLRPWLDTIDLLPGMDWKREIANAMQSSDVIVLLMSPVSVRKEGFVQKEVHDAIELSQYKPPGSIHLIPAKLAPCELNFGKLRDLHAEDMYPDWDRGIATLIRAVEFAKAQRTGVFSTSDVGQFENGQPIGPRLQASGRIYKGEVRYTKSSMPMQALLEMAIPVDRGEIVRNEQGHLEATIWMKHPMMSMREMSEKLGLDGSVRLVSQSATLSIDPTQPTVFEGSRLIVLPKGTEIPSLDVIGKKNVMPVTVIAASCMRISGHLRDKIFAGDFVLNTEYSVLGLTLALEGKVEVQFE